MPNRVWKTQDIALAAYVDMVAEISRECGEENGVRLVKVEENGKNSVFVFRDPQNLVDQIVVNYIESESFRFDAKVRVLKSIGYSMKSKRRGAGNGRR